MALIPPLATGADHAAKLLSYRSWAPGGMDRLTELVKAGNLVI